VLGLGNPGGEYATTRHNLGWMTLEELERRGRFTRERREGPARLREGSIEGFDVVLARPQTYMNLSGRAGRHLTERLGIPVPDVVVVYDELDLPFGRLRLRRGGSAGGHNGVRSLMESWQTADFIRVRIGIGRPPEGVDPLDFILQPFTPDERAQLPAVVTRAADAVVTIVRDGLDPAMNEFNRKPDLAAGADG
jgi:PTH1 family peptidyl-tRNA hydrolase